MAKKKPKSTRPMIKISPRVYEDQLPISAAEIREAIDYYRRRDKKADNLFFH